MRAGDVITVKGEGGAVWDQTVPADGTNQRELLDTFLASGKLTLVGGEATPAEPEPAPADEEPANADPDQDLPVKSASKPEWMAYAVSQGIDPASADAMSKAELVALYSDGAGPVA